MAIATEVSYMRRLNSHLRNYKEKGPNLWEFSCPYCGDSKKDPTKTRGFIFLPSGKNTHFFKCHNCAKALGFSKFLKDQNATLHKEYRLETYRELNPDGDIKVIDYSQKQTEAKAHKVFEPLKELRKVSQLPHAHPAKQYVTARKIPPETHYKIYWVDNFNGWYNTIVPLSEKELAHTEGRLVFPYFDSDGICFGVAGRSLDAETTRRYIIHVWDKTKPGLYGLDQIVWNKPVYITEGQIDSLFLPNAFASCGMFSHIEHMSGLDRDNITLITDNQPRNKQVVDNTEKLIKNGWRVMIWPVHIESKDINDYVITSGEKELVKFVKDHAYKGGAALLHFNNWKRL